MEKKAELVLDCYWLTKTRLKYLDSTSAYYNDYAIVIVPPGQDLSPFNKLLSPFTLIVWSLLLLCIIIGIVVIIVVRLHFKSFQNFLFGERVNYPILNIFIALLGGTQYRLPRTTFGRFLLMNFLLFSLNMRTLYQGSMFQIMQSNRKYSEMQSVDEIIASGFKFHILKTTSDLFSHHSSIKTRCDWFLRWLLTIFLKFKYFHRIVNITSQRREQMLTEIENPSFKGTVILGLYKILHRNFMNRDKFQLIICKERLMSISIVMYTQKNFYLTEALNEKISLFQAAGLIQYWHIYERKNFIDDSNPPKILTFHQLLGAFQILLCGCGISALVFIAEIIAKSKFNFLSMNLHKWMFLIFIEITINFNCSPKILKWQCDVITKAECCCWHLCCVAMLENDFNDVYASLNIHLVSMFSLKMNMHAHTRILLS